MYSERACFINKEKLVTHKINEEERAKTSSIVDSSLTGKKIRKKKLHFGETSGITR